MTIAPTSASIDAAVVGSGNTQQFTASALYSDGSTKDVTSTTQWASSNSGSRVNQRNWIGNCRDSCGHGLGNHHGDRRRPFKHGDFDGSSRNPVHRGDTIGRFRSSRIATTICGHGNVLDRGRHHARRRRFDCGYVDLWDSGYGNN